MQAIVPLHLWILLEAGAHPTATGVNCIFQFRVVPMPVSKSQSSFLNNNNNNSNSKPYRHNPSGEPCGLHSNLRPTYHRYSYSHRNSTYNHRYSSVHPIR
uniref:Putative secreted protein n=1 Tax=Anopheles darlingi TaxID=43151 RepID=A0A2M4DDS5_ANODA